MKLPRTVYLIRHNKTNRVYIGSSADPSRRFKDHIWNLRRGKHPVEDMQFDFDTYGEDYSIEYLEVINAYEDGMHEYDWMEKYSSHIRGIGYNYKDWANLERVRTISAKTRLIQLIKSITDEEAERFMAFMEAQLERKENT